MRLAEWLRQVASGRNAANDRADSKKFPNGKIAIPNWIHTVICEEEEDGDEALIQFAHADWMHWWEVCGNKEALWNLSTDAAGRAVWRFEQSFFELLQSRGNTAIITNTNAACDRINGRCNAVLGAKCRYEAKTWLNFSKSNEGASMEIEHGYAEQFPRLSKALNKVAWLKNCVRYSVSEIVNYVSDIACQSLFL